MNAILALILRIILIAFAYGFVGGIGYLVYQNLRIIVKNEGLVTIPPITLTFDFDQETISKKFFQPEIILGRDPSCDLALDNGTISLRHCRLAFHDKQWWVEDLDSTNGSYINNVLIETPTVITAGDQLKLGRILINITENQT